MARSSRPPKPLTPRQKAALIRKLSWELGVDPFLGAKGIALAAAVMSVVAALVFFLKAPTAPPDAVWGRVETARLVVDEKMTMQVVRLETGGTQASVDATGWPMCGEGDRIALTRHHSRVAVRYEMRPPGCTHVR